MRLIRLAVPVVALAVSLPAYAAAAEVAPDRPSRAEIRDSRHDVWRIVDPPSGRDRTSRLPARRVGDVTTVRVLHTAGSVVIRTRMAALGRLDRALGAPVVQLRLPRLHLTAIWAKAGDLGPGVAPQLVLYETYGGGFVDCPGATRTVRRGAGAIELAIPRTCLGNPGWVRTRSVPIWHRLTGPRAERRDVYLVDVAPGPRLRFRGALSSRAYAPPAAVVDDAAPPTQPTRPSVRSGPVGRLLERVG